jgi:hypothetical protein
MLPPPDDSSAAAANVSPTQGSLLEQLSLMMQARTARTLQQVEEPQNTSNGGGQAEAEQRELAEEEEFGRAAIPPPSEGAANGLFSFPADLPREDEDALRSYMRPRLPVTADGQDLAYTSDARETAIRFAAAGAKERSPSSSPSSQSSAARSGANYGGARNTTLFLSRGALRIGVDCSRGATIFYLGLEGDAARQGERAARGVPGDLLGRSLVNGYDCGRGLQQSYYGCWDGSCWPPGKSWLYNPVQCGSWTDKPSTVTRCEMLGGGDGVREGDGGPVVGGGGGAAASSKRALADTPAAQRIVTSVIPRNWGGGQLLPEVRMDSDIALSPKGEVARIRFSMKYGATANADTPFGSSARLLTTGATATPSPHPLRMQEVPAVFVDRRLSSLVFYNRTRDRQWTDPWGKLTLAQPKDKNEYYLPTERWTAYVFPGTGWGVGVYSPMSDVVTAYRVGPNPSPPGRPPPTSDVSYFAPTVKFPLTPGQTYTYDVYVAVGTIGDLRAHFARIAERTGRAPSGSARRMAEASEASTADVGARAAAGLVGGGGGGLVGGAPASG